MNDLLSVPTTVAKKPIKPDPNQSRTPEPARERFDLRLDPEIRERLTRQANRFGLSLSAYIRSGMIEKLERDEATDPSAQDD